MRQPIGIKPLSEYVPRLYSLQDNDQYGNLKGRVVAALTRHDPNIHQAILDAGVNLYYIVGDDDCKITDPRIVHVAGNPWDVMVSGVDVAFFDSRAVADFDHIQGIVRLMDHMSSVLTPQGIVFAIILTGNVHQGFDVFNSIIQTPIGSLPSSEYFFDELLNNCAIRMLDWIPSEHPTVTTRFMRLALKKPSLLLVFGASQSGKTSLARDFIRLDRHMHVSNDYIYCELARLRNTLKNKCLPAEILGIVGDGGGVACGNFNRALENDPSLLLKYLSIVETLLPKNKRLISMELDLREKGLYDIAKKFFADKGYSVWVVAR